MSSPDIVRACEVKITHAIVTEFRDSCFYTLVDEWRDVSMKEQIAVVLHYVDNRGHVVERFFVVLHIEFYEYRSMVP